MFLKKKNRNSKALNKINKKNVRVKREILNELQSQLLYGECVEGIVCYKRKNMYIATTNKGRVFIAGIKIPRNAFALATLTEMVLDSKEGIYVCYNGDTNLDITVELSNGTSISILRERDLYIRKEIYRQAVTLLNK